MSNVRSCPSSSSSSCASDPETIQHTSFECKAFVKERGKIPSGSYSVRPLGRQLTDEYRRRHASGSMPCNASMKSISSFAPGKKT